MYLSDFALGECKLFEQLLLILREPRPVVACVLSFHSTSEGAVFRTYIESMVLFLELVNILCKHFVLFSELLVYLVTMNNTAYEFWKRVDDLRGKLTISEIGERTGVKEQRIKHLRSEVRYPKVEDCILIARILNCSLDYLVFGTEALDLSPEARYVENNAPARTLVSTIMKDPPLLSALSLVIESTRANIDKGEKSS